MEINATIIVQLVVFLTLMLWLSKVLFKPLMKLFDERENRIQGAKEAALSLDAQSEEKLQVVEEKMRKAQKEAREMLANIKEEGVLYHRRLVDDARANAREKIAIAKKAIYEDLERARQEMPPFIDENAKLLVNKFLFVDTPNTQKSGSSKLEFKNA